MPDNNNNNTVISLCYPILFSFSSLSLVLPTMINSFKKNIYSLLSCTTTTVVHCHHHHHHSISDLGLVTVTMEVDRPPNVLESATLKPNPPTPLATSPSGGVEFVDDMVDGLMSCTESLGFESSDEIHNKNIDENVNDDDEVWKRRMMRAEGKGNWRSFPPPLSSLNRNGKPSFFLRPVRKDGRLELTEVRIHRPEILHASRHDGRLTLHLIPDQEEEEEEELVEEEEVEEEEEEEEEEEKVAEWGFSVGSSEGLMRCHEMVNQHHHVHGNHHHMRMCGISIV